MKKIITHINPDLDAVAAVWLIKRFLPGWEEAEVGFVEAESTTEEKPQTDKEPDVLYVDVGRGKLDHHQTGEYLSAAKLCWEYKCGKIVVVKKIVTHINPDLDAVAAVWLIKKFLPGWEKVEVGFVEASSSTESVAGIDDNPDILYVDVGRGKLDHHQTGEYLSAAKLCWEYIKENRKGKEFSELEEKAIQRLVEVVTEVDNARDLNWEEAGKDRARFYLHNLIDSLRGLAASDQEVMDFGLKMLDAVLWNLKNRLRAEEELKKGIEFTTPWGKGIAMETGNKQVLWEGEARGYALAVIKDPETGGVRIHARPDSEVDLSLAYRKVKELDHNSDWFLHASKKMLLNQASVVQMRPTKLSLEEIIGILIKCRKVSS